MRKLFLLIILCLSTSLMASTHIEVSGGNAVLLSSPINIDYVYVFEDLTGAQIETGDSKHTWLDLLDGSEVSNQNYIFPENNRGYILQTNTDTTTFWVIDYSQYKPVLEAFAVNTSMENGCELTELVLDGTLPTMSYQDEYGATHTVKDSCTITYHSLAWGGEDWQDSLCVQDVVLSKHLHVKAPLQNTVFTLTVSGLASKLGLESDSISTEEYAAIAVAIHPTTITTTRGEDGELSNEAERPIESTQLEGSAPLDIYFEANATPAAKYYTWKLLRGNDLVVERRDSEQRYKFDNYGEYMVKIAAGNDFCHSDTTEIKISVATSQLVAPNVFTPNGDGKNDEFRVMYRSIVDFHCWVYNRWGRKVFEWTDPAKGWDGNINGRQAAESAYFYVIRATGADGKKYELKGDINLIRGGHK